MCKETGFASVDGPDETIDAHLATDFLDIRPFARTDKTVTFWTRDDVCLGTASDVFTKHQIINITCVRAGGGRPRHISVGRSFYESAPQWICMVPH